MRYFNNKVLSELKLQFGFGANTCLCCKNKFLRIRYGYYYKVQSKEVTCMLIFTIAISGTFCSDELTQTET